MRGRRRHARRSVRERRIGRLRKREEGGVARFVEARLRLEQHTWSAAPVSKRQAGKQAGKIATSRYRGHVVSVASDHENGNATWEVELFGGRDGRSEVDVGQRSGAIMKVETGVGDCTLGAPGMVARHEPAIAFWARAELSCRGPDPE